jgi:hypothetical protein
MELPVPLCFRSSCQSMLRRITNFGNAALMRYTAADRALDHGLMIGLS